jgi:hypothetical protein
MSENVQVALIAALAGLLGVVAGGLITYAANRSLQDDERQRQELLEARAAQSAARREFSRLEQVRGPIEAMLEGGLYISIPTSSMRPTLTTDESAQMLAWLDDGQSQAYAGAERCLVELQARFHPKRDGTKLEAIQRVPLKITEKCLVRGQDSLRDLVRGHPDRGPIELDDS